MRNLTHLQVTLFLILISQLTFGQFNLISILPKAENSKLIQHSGYVVRFDTVNCVPDFSAYILTKNELLNPVTQRDKFHFTNDPAVFCERVEYYKHSGFDRGHLTPAADMKYSENSEHDCFYISNICPQKHFFNAGIWEDLEKKVRDWAYKYDSLIVISAPVVQTCHAQGNLTVPAQFYKIIYSIKHNKGVAFLMNADLCEGNIFDYEVSISDLDKQVKLSYFTGNKYHLVISNIDKDFWK